MTVYRLFWLLETEYTLYLLSGQRPEPCTVRMTASAPKKVNRSIELWLDAASACILCEDSAGRILWQERLPVTRDGEGKLSCNVTDVLREKEIPFSFCPVGRLRHYQAHPSRLRLVMQFYDWGYMTSREGYCWDSPGGTCLTFYPGKLFACGAEIFRVRPEAFGWNGEELCRQVKLLRTPADLEEETVCRCMEAWGELSRLSLTGGNVLVEIRAFFLTSFEVAGFGRKWTYDISPALFQKDGCAPCKTPHFAPLLCRLLRAASAEEADRALCWGVKENLLRTPKA